MTKRRLNISIALMVMAIIAVVSFQVYWLVKSYREEKQSLNIRANVLFRDAVFQTQASLLKLDTSGMKIRMTGRVDAVRVLTNLKEKLRDSNGPVFEHNSSFVSVDKDGVYHRKDSLITTRLDSPRTRKTLITVGPQQRAFFEVFEGVDSLQELITEKAVGHRYAHLMKNEKLNLPFTITKTPETPKEGLLRKVEALGESNEVTIGFAKPYVFRMELKNIVSHLFKKLSVQILISLLLVGLTVMSFIVLLRNLIQQRKLTQLKNDFISNITHELKTPLATVSVAIEALKNFNALQDPARTMEYLDISSNELQRLSLLVDKVLKLSMFEKQEIELKYEWFDLKQLITEIVGSMRLQFEKFHAKVNVQLPDDEVNIKADRLHITSVIFNLLDNALKYAKTHPSVYIGLKEDINEIEFSVTDNGIGISPEFKAKIFDKFFRVPTGDQHNVKGYGLGLSYVTYVVERHKGNIDVESQEGIGSRFIVKLPKA